MDRAGAARPVVTPKYDAVGLVILANMRTAGPSRREYLRLLEKV